MRAGSTDEGVGDARAGFVGATRLAERTCGTAMPRHPPSRSAPPGPDTAPASATGWRSGGRCVIAPLVGSIESTVATLRSDASRPPMMYARLESVIAAACATGTGSVPSEAIFPVFVSNVVTESIGPLAP